MKTKTEKFKAMFSRYSVTVSEVARNHTLAEIETMGAAAAKKLEDMRHSALQWTGREHNMWMNMYSNEVKTLRCAWYAIRNGWVQS